MARAEADPDQIDRLLNLPDELLLTILSFLPTHVAARTSVLCRRFRHLWEASPSLQFIFRKLPSPKWTIHRDNFIAMTDRPLRRNPSHPLLSLHLEFSACFPSLPDSYLSSLLAKAGSLGLRHLTVKGDCGLVCLLPTIFSIDSLQSLSLPTTWHCNSLVFPPRFPLTCLRLRSLSLGLVIAYSDNLSQLISELCSLEDLHLKIYKSYRLSLSSQTIRKLKLIIGSGDPKLYTLELFLPSLKSLHLETEGSFSSQFHIDVKVPLLKRGVIIFDKACAQNVSTRLLNSISHVEELSLHVKVSG